ncbi:hypothetical protein L6R49_07280 [Myxococcota bacterium]|nr:hypothetical protein [Myxococcota bacterium]
MMMKPTLVWSLALALLVGCSDKETSDDGRDTDVPVVEDRDGDGKVGDDDCDDDDSSVYVGADELCDGVDNDCDGELDPIGYLDVDGDGFGDLDNPVSCSESAITDSTDCDDADGLIFPGAPERCNTQDDDCDGEIDEDVSASSTFYLDGDGDGYGDTDETYVGCNPQSGYVIEGGDCDDDDAAISPGADERCSTTGVDDDCDGSVDEGGAVDAKTYYPDADRDTYGDERTPTPLCSAPSGYTTNNDDCDDADDAVNPDAEEVCDNGVDDNCDDSAEPCGLSGTTKLSDSTYVAAIWGGAASDALGASLQAGRPGDHNGDGLGDLIIGADGASSNTGAAYLMRTPFVKSKEATFATAIITGDQAAMELGEVVAWAGDIGARSYETGAITYDDMMIGAPYYDASSRASSGAVYLIFGEVSNALSTDADAIIYGGSSSMQLGSALSGPGDISGDGEDDIVLGAIGATGGASKSGAVFLFFGDIAEGSATTTASASVQLQGVSSQDQFGAWISGPMDLDGDGDGDLGVGAPAADPSSRLSAGSAYVFYGPFVKDVNELASAADFTLTGSVAGDGLGGVVEAAGDFDGDGYGDLMVSAPNAQGLKTGSGVVYLVLGSSKRLSGTNDVATVMDIGVQGLTTDDGIGTRLAPAGDVNNDGLADILIGAPRYSSRDTGAAYLVYGDSAVSGLASVSSFTRWEVTSSSTNDYVGSAVGGVGDTNGDGFDDFVIGAVGYDYSSRSGSGGLFLFLGGGY